MTAGEVINPPFYQTATLTRAWKREVVAVIALFAQAEADVANEMNVAPGWSQAWLLEGFLVNAGVTQKEIQELWDAARREKKEALGGY